MKKWVQSIFLFFYLFSGFSQNLKEQSGNFGEEDEQKKMNKMNQNYKWCAKKFQTKLLQSKWLNRLWG